MLNLSNSHCIVITVLIIHIVFNQANSKIFVIDIDFLILNLIIVKVNFINSKCFNSIIDLKCNFMNSYC